MCLSWVSGVHVHGTRSECVRRAAVVRVQIVKRQQLAGIATNNAIKIRRNKYERIEKNVTCEATTATANTTKWSISRSVFAVCWLRLILFEGSTFQRYSLILSHYLLLTIHSIQLWLHSYALTPHSKQKRSNKKQTHELNTRSIQNVYVSLLPSGVIRWWITQTTERPDRKYKKPITKCASLSLARRITIYLHLYIHLNLHLSNHVLGANTNLYMFFFPFFPQLAERTAWSRRYWLNLKPMAKPTNRKWNMAN